MCGLQDEGGKASKRKSTSGKMEDEDRGGRRSLEAVLSQKVIDSPVQYIQYGQVPYGPTLEK